MGDDHKRQHSKEDPKEHDDNPGEDTVSYCGVETRGAVSRDIDLWVRASRGQSAQPEGIPRGTRKILQRRSKGAHRQGEFALNA
jgi:hypothetical protein